MADFTREQLADRMLHRRAVDAVVWGHPGGHFDLMFQQMAKPGGDWNRIVRWPGLLDWTNQTLTPKPDVICLMPFFNNQAGPTRAAASVRRSLADEAA